MMKKWPILALTLALGVSAAVYAANDSEPAIVRRDNDAPLATSATSGAGLVFPSVAGVSEGSEEDDSPPTVET